MHIYIWFIWPSVWWKVAKYCRMLPLQTQQTW